MTRWSCSFVLLVSSTTLLCAAPALRAQDEAVAPRVVCRSCENRGELDCQRHKKAELEMEQQVVYCSEAAACKRCAGALTIDCKICNNTAVEAAAETRRKLCSEWLAERRAAVDDYTLGKGILHGKTDHVDLTFSLRPTMIGRRKVGTHELMHLYLTRLESLRQKFMDVLELTERDFPRADEQVSPRLKVFMFEDRFDHRKVAPRVTGIGSHGTGVKLMGIQLAYCMYHDDNTLPDDDAVHRSIVHNVIHLLLSSAQPTVWIGNRGHGWLDEGLAHYFEFMVDERCTNFCFEEVGITPGQGFNNGRWRLGVRKMLETGKLRPFVDLYDKNSDQLDFEAHAQVFGYVDFLISAYGGAKFRDLVRRVKSDKATRDALSEVYGFGPLQVDDLFKEWVRNTYPLTAR